MVSQESSRGRVLLVDDDADVRRDYARMLRRLGYEVDLAEDGKEAMVHLRATAYDAVVSDISMPQMGGLEFLRAVRERDLDVPVVLMTGDPGLGTAVEAVRYGAFRYLAKPTDFETLGEVLRSAVSMHRLARLKREALELVGHDGGRQLGDRASLEARFEAALERLWMAYQPIVDWPGKTVFAYEALVRSSEPTLGSPLDLLDAAERLGRLHELGRCIRERVASAAAGAPGAALLFVNLHAVDLNDGELFSPRSPLSAIASRVVLEVTERASLHVVKDLQAKVRALGELGFRIAIDDLGAGYAGLASFSQLDPAFAKLDMSLVRGVDASPRKQSVIRAMTELCRRDLGIQVVSEGVETREERDALALAGCDLLQGYLFAKPDPRFATPRW